MKKLLSFLKPYKLLLFIGPMFKLFEAILELMLPYLMSKIIDIGVANGDKDYVLKMGGVMILTASIGVICACICQYSASIVAGGTAKNIRNALFFHIGTFSNAELDKFSTSSLINRITNDVNQVQWAVAMLIRLVIRAPFLCIGGIVMTFIMNARLAIILVIVIPIFILILIVIMKKTIPLYRKVQNKLDKIALVIRENLSGVRVIRAFARVDHEKLRFAKRNKEYEENSILVGRISALLNPLTALVMNFAICAVVWFGGVFVNEGSMQTGEIMAFIGYVTQILASLIIISNLVIVYTKAFASAGRIIEVFEMDSTIKDGEKISEIQSDNIVEFKNVFMDYDGGKDYDISNISFNIKRGETVGIIGSTGSGKSTVINLIGRFYDASSGNVLVDGIDVKDYKLEDLRSKIGIVPQKTVLFTRSIAENIRWGKEDATMEEIILAANIANASEFIDKLKDGYDTKVSRGGLNLSGGQRQRITIARAIVKKPDILILDDSFNALDYITDRAVRKSIKEYSKNMTTFIVSQRVSTVKESDKIIVLNEGEIVGIGTNEELFRTCEVYEEICRSQLQETEVKQ